MTGKSRLLVVHSEDPDMAPVLVLNNRGLYNTGNTLWQVGVSSHQELASWRRFRLQAWNSQNCMEGLKSFALEDQKLSCRAKRETGMLEA